MSVCKYAHFFMSLSEHLESTLEHSLPSLNHFCELIDLNWIETSLHQSEGENYLLSMWFGLLLGLPCFEINPSGML